MTGIWEVKENGEMMKDHQGFDRHFEGIELPELVFDFVGRARMGNKLELICLLGEGAP